MHGDGWVDPISGDQASSFNRDDPVYINFYSYEGVPRMEQDAAGDTTLRQPVYIANPNVLPEKCRTPSNRGPTSRSWRRTGDRWVNTSRQSSRSQALWQEA